MRKEVLFAILTGSLLGLVIAFGVWRANVALKGTLSQNKTNNKQEQKQDQTTKQFGLTIASPENHFVSVTKSIDIKGVTKPNIPVVIIGVDEDTIQTTDNQGAFTASVDLTGGINPLSIISMDPSNGVSEEKLSLVYSSEFKKFMEESDSETKTSTSSAESLREKVQKKLEQAKEKPLAVIGTVTDITDSTIQVKDDTGEIMQISLNEDETEYVNIQKTAKKIEHKEVAIGDYIAALGFMKDDNAIEGKRILVTTKPETTQLKAVLGSITKIEKKKVTFKDNSDKEWTTEFGKSWTGPDLDEIEEGRKIIVVGTEADATLTSPRTLYLIEQ